MEFYSQEDYLVWLDQLADDDFVVIDNFISSDLYQQMYDFFQERLLENDLEKAGIGALGDHTIEKKIRGDYVYWLDETRDIELDTFYQLLAELVGQLKRLCFLAISDVECHLAYYPTGTFYKKHVDQFKERSNRMISFVLYLNPNWKEGDGGELLIHKENRQIKIAPKKSRLILFKSADVEHEVLTTNTERLSLTGWMLNNPVGLGFLNT